MAKIDKEAREIDDAKNGIIIPKMCKFYAHYKTCKNMIISGVCPYHHDSEIREMRSLT